MLAPGREVAGGRVGVCRNPGIRGLSSRRLSLSCWTLEDFLGLMGVDRPSGVMRLSMVKARFGRKGVEVSVIDMGEIGAGTDTGECCSIGE